MNVSIMEMCLCKPCIYALAYYCAVELSQMTRLKLAGAMQMHAGEMGEMMEVLGRLSVGKYKIQVQLQICVPQADFFFLILKNGLSSQSMQFGTMPLEVPGSSGMIEVLDEDQKLEEWRNGEYTEQEYKEWLGMVEGREMIWQLIVDRYNASREAVKYHE